MPQFFQTTQIARPAYYDRQAIGVLNAYAATLAPHALTTRWTYTPVNGGAAFIETIALEAIRTAVAGALSASAVNIVFAPFYGGSFVLAGANIFDNVLYSKDEAQITSLGYMAFGDTLSLQTVDTDTGGQIFMRGTFKGSEFVF